MMLESPEATILFAQVIGTVAQAGDNLVLTGDLGAGKTTLTKGIAQGLGIDQMIKSPTYTIIREYTQGRLPLYHMDVYRLEDVGGDDLGFEEYLYGNGVSVIEWAKFIEEELPAAYLTIRLVPTGEFFENREITFIPTGDRYKSLVETLREIFKKEGR